MSIYDGISSILLGGGQISGLPPTICNFDGVAPSLECLPSPRAWWVRGKLNMFNSTDVSSLKHWL